MRIAIIDTTEHLYNSLEILFQKSIEFEPIIVIPSEENKLLALAETIIKLENIDTYIINLEGEFEGTARNECTGADLIFWLRLKHNLGKPIIITAFQGLLQILKSKPTYTVLNAKEVYFVDILSDFTILNKIKEAKKVGLSKEQIRVYYIVHANNVLNLADIRHQEANWFALKNLWDCHTIIKKGDFQERQPKILLNNLNNFLAAYIYQISDKRLTDLINESEKEISGKNQEKILLLNKIESSINDNTFDIDYSNLEIEKLKKEIKELEQNWFNSPLLSQNEKNIKVSEKTEKDLEIDVLKERIELITELLNTKINERNIANEFSAEREVFNNLLQSLRIDNEDFNILQNKKFLLIDDQANDGWSDIYQYIIFDSLKPTQFFSLEFEIYSLDAILKEAKNFIEKNEIDLIFLDIRLLPDKDKQHEENLSKLSGIQVLKAIVKEYPEIPIIITSASNKIWTYREVLSLGASAYWIKNGIDNKVNAEGSLRNYKEFKKNINILFNDEFQLLRKMIENRNELFKQTSLWWENHTWSGGNQTTCNHDEVKLIYNDLIFNYKDFLRNKYLHSHPELINFWFNYSSLIIHMGKVVEKIHNLDQNIYRQYGPFGALIRQVEDNRGIVLYDLRNDAAHFSESTKIKFDDFKLYYTRFHTYLNN